MPTIKTIFAAQAAVPANPPNPSAAAINAITKNVIAHENMLKSPFMNTFSATPSLKCRQALYMNKGSKSKYRQKDMPHRKFAAG